MAAVCWSAESVRGGSGCPWGLFGGLASLRVGWMLQWLLLPRAVGRPVTARADTQSRKARDLSWSV